MLVKMMAVLAVVSCMFVTSGKDDATEVKAELKDVKCLLMPKKEVKETFSVDYMDAKVYFCCKGCVGKFSKSPDKYATLANHQLVQTKLFKQTGCPISGGDLDPATEIEVNGVKVQFCCNNCKAKADAMKTDAEKAELVFSKDAFKKGFAKVEAKKTEESAK